MTEPNPGHATEEPLQAANEVLAPLVGDMAVHGAHDGHFMPIRSAWSARCGGASTTRGPVEPEPAAISGLVRQRSAPSAEHQP